MKQENKEKILTTRNMAFIALFAAVTCLIAPVSVQIGPVPVSLGFFAVYLCGAFLGPKRGTLAVIVYILLGAVGMPVFTGFMGGLAKLLGVTGGYIIGYVPMALITGLFSEKNRRLAPVGMVLGSVACYIFGTAWFMIFTGSDLVTALMACVVPFLWIDALKVIAASALVMPLKPRLDKLMERG